jgi:hypothetical protein
MEGKESRTLSPSGMTVFAGICVAQRHPVNHQNSGIGQVPVFTTNGAERAA